MTGVRWTRRHFMKAAGLGGFVAAGTPVVGGGGQRGGKRPNFVVIITDDQRHDALGCAGNPIIRTPEMDLLAAGGVRFDHAFVSTPICAASRASIFTGLYERRHGFTFGTPPLARGFTDISYPALLRKAGYVTGFVGKFGVAVDEGAVDDMFDVFEPFDRNPYFKEIDGRRIHLTDLTGDRAVSFLRERTGDEPFCLSISFNAPHAEDSDPRQYIWPPSCDGMYDHVTIPPPVNGDQAFFQRQPFYLRESLNRTRWNWRFDTPEKYREMVRGYYRMISGVDRVVGQVREELESLGLADNTVIMLMGDNGYFLGERGFAGKWLMYDLFIRVPLIIHDPRGGGAAAGTLRDDMVLNIDLSPTMLELAGLDIPDTVQGRSLVPLLDGTPVEWRSEIFCEHLFDRADIPQSEGIRTRRWKYLRYRHQPTSEELYDLDADPHEEHDLAWRHDRFDTLARLRERCDRNIEAWSR